LDSKGSRHSQLLPTIPLLYQAYSSMRKRRRCNTPCDENDQIPLPREIANWIFSSGDLTLAGRRCEYRLQTG
jgi:hypothetical protein